MAKIILGLTNAALALCVGAIFALYFLGPNADPGTQHTLAAIAYYLFCAFVVGLFATFAAVMLSRCRSLMFRR